MYDLVCRADTLFLAAQIRMEGILLTGNEWDFLMEDPEDGVFATLIDKAEDIGASGYQLLMTIGVIGLVFSIIFTAISLLMTSNAQKKEEKKSHALVICVAGICIFSVFSIVGFFQINRLWIIVSHLRWRQKAPPFFFAQKFGKEEEVGINRSIQGTKGV